MPSKQSKTKHYMITYTNSAFRVQARISAVP